MILSTRMWRVHGTLMPRLYSHQDALFIILWTMDIIKNKGHLWRIKGSRFVFQKFPSKFWTVNGIPTCTAMKLNVCTVGVSCFKCLPGHLATYTLKVQDPKNVFFIGSISNSKKRDIICKECYEIQSYVILYCSNSIEYQWILYCKSIALHQNCSAMQK